MNNCHHCPECEAEATQDGQPSARVFFACGSYGYKGEIRLTNQTDLCRAWETLRELSNLTTTDHETKAEFIARVRMALGMDKTITPPPPDVLGLRDCLDEINHALNHWYPTKTSADEDERNARHVRLFSFRDRLEQQLEGGKP